MGTGWMRMGLPIRTLPAACFSPLLPEGAAGTEAAGRLPAAAAWEEGALQVTSVVTCRKPYTPISRCFSSSSSASPSSALVVRRSASDMPAWSMQAPFTTAPAKRSRSSPESCSSVNISKKGISLDIDATLLNRNQMLRNQKLGMRNSGVRQRRTYEHCPTRGGTQQFRIPNFSFLMGVFQFPPSACPPAAPAVLCKGFLLCGKSVPHPCRQRCRYLPPLPRRGR